MLLSASLLLLATLPSGVNPSAKIMSPIQNTDFYLHTRQPGKAQSCAAAYAGHAPRISRTLPTAKRGKRAGEQIRQQVLVSCGLYPLPPKTPLKAKIFGRVERDGYTIEKVYFQTYPGFYLAGNLYRPGKGIGSRGVGSGGVRKNAPHTPLPTPDIPAF